MNLIFTGKDKGCWIDGAFGLEHACDQLSVLLDDIPETKDIRKDLSKFQGDFIDEIQNEATEILQENTADGLTWIWEAGDLILTDEMEGE